MSACYYRTDNLIFRDEWKPTPRTRDRKSTTQSWFIPMLENLNWIELLRSMQDPFTTASTEPEPEPASDSESAPSASAPSASARSTSARPSAATESSSQAPPQPKEKPVDKLLKDNEDVYKRLVNHPFPRALGDGTASLDGFRYYMIVGHSFFLPSVLISKSSSKTHTICKLVPP